MAPIAKATIVNSSLARNYVTFGSEITLFGSNLDLADRVTITDSSASPSFQFRSTNFVVVNSTEIRITIPQRVDPSRTFTNNTWYEINVSLSSTSDSNYLGIFLYEAQPFDGSDGNIPCSQDGFVSVSAKILNSNTACTGSLAIPEGVTSIGNSVFYSTTTLNSVSFPSTLTVIGVQAFGLVTSLTNVNFVEGLTDISYLAFVGTHLTSVEFPNSLTTIGESAFEQTMLSTASFGSGLHTIESKAFKNTNLTNITIPSSVTTIGDEAFQNIETLQSIEYCWPSGILAVDVLNGLEYVDLICNQRTTIEVTNLLASGSGSLTEAITQIAASDVQDSFLVILPAGIINVADGFPEITRDTEIRGQGSSSILNLIDFGTNIAQDVLFKTNRTSVDLVLKNIVVQGTITTGSAIRNDQGNIQISNSIFKNITNSGFDGLIENYADLNSRLYSTISIQDTVFQNVSGSRIFFSDYGYTPSTSLNDLDYNNKIYNNRNTFDNVTSIAEVQRFLKIENSTFKNSISPSLSIGNNRFQLLNSTFENGISLNLSTAWDPLTSYSTRAGIQTSLSALEKVVSGNTFKNISALTPFVSLNTSSSNLGLLTFTNNDFQFTTNTSQKSPELQDVLSDSVSYTTETVFTGNRYFYASTITFNGNGATSGTMANSIGVATANLPSNQFAKAGFNFNGWNSQADGLGASYGNLAPYTYGADQTLYAIWSLISPTSNSAVSQEKAKQARELQELLTVLPSIGNLALEIGKLIEKMTIKKCVKGKKVKNVKAGAKCPNGYKARK
jgi:uncharacterized repeat protein (TIGR02543 family)